MENLNKPFFRKPFRYTFFNATLILVLINVAVYVLSWLLKNSNIKMLCSLNVLCINYYHMYWQFVTYMFIHGNFSHIFFNMLGLLMFGSYLEKAIGSKEFLLFYFVCGILSGFFSYIFYFFTHQYYAFLMGASGAIYAVLFAYAVFYPNSVIHIWGIIPVPAPILVLVYAIIEFLSQFFGSGQGVAHITHLFGFIVAWLYFVIRMGIHPIKIWKNAYKK